MSLIEHHLAVTFSRDQGDRASPWLFPIKFHILLEFRGRGGGATQKIYWWMCALAQQKVGLRCGHSFHIVFISMLWNSLFPASVKIICSAVSVLSFLSSMLPLLFMVIPRYLYVLVFPVLTYYLYGLVYGLVHYFCFSLVFLYMYLVLLC